MDQKDFYQILGINKDAAPEEIRQAYRKLAFQYHPDRNGDDPSATGRMKEINQAYAILSNPAKKQEYDALKERFGYQAYDRFTRAHSTEDIFRGSDIAQVFEELTRTFGFRSPDDILRQFYGPGYRSFEFRRGGISARGFVFTGGAGSGAQFPETGKDHYQELNISPETARNGGEVGYRLENSGRPRNIMVKVPAGVTGRQQIRLKGLGGPGRDGGEPGDLYLQVKIKSSLLQRIKAFFSRRGWHRPPRL